MSEPIQILHEDPHLLVALKPAGLLSVPTPGAQGRTMLDALAEQGLRALPVHRLDRDVSGAMLFARDPAARAALETLFRERAIRKLYWALALMGPKRDSGAIQFPILEQGAQARVSAVGKPAKTLYRVLQRGLAANEVEVEIVTGRYNQIRLHFAHSGWPLVGDRKYGKFKQDPLRSTRIALHAWKLEFEHPHTHRRISLEAPLSDDLCALRERALKR
ncbi:MAG: RluA family pseudouridine synthase [Planctomycetes bacterium]|nr:RluA family pseudouridine synthase [Planctomycetota bacterium]